MTIRSVLIINNHGKPRLTKFYSPLSTVGQQQLIRLIFTLVSQREQTHNPDGNSDSLVCNFLDAPELTPLLPPSSHVVNFKSRESKAKSKSSSGNFVGTKKGKERKAQDDELRVIYRHYATLYFVFVADTSESELGILDLIQVSSSERDNAGLGSSPLLSIQDSSRLQTIDSNLCSETRLRGGKARLAVICLSSENNTLFQA